MATYCECPFPAPHPTLGKCGRCLRSLEPEDMQRDAELKQDIKRAAYDAKVREMRGHA